MAARVGLKADYWRRVIRRQDGSGLSVRAWCGRHDVPEARGINPSQFVPVRVAADPAGAANSRPGCIEIILSGERRVRVFGPVDRQALAGVLAVLHADDTDTVTPAGDREAAAC
jgi:hypothetical protein